MKISYQLDTADFRKSLGQFASDFEKEVKDAVLIATRQLSLDAKRFAPVDKGGLRSGIRPYNKGLSGEVVASKEYSPYQEFGTGTKVNVPSELTDYAMQFKGRGLRKVNMKAQPFLYPAFNIQQDKFPKDIERRFDKVKNKNWK